MKYRMQWDDEEQAKLNCLGTDIDPKEDQTRQELVPESDLNTLLRRYSPYELPRGEVFYGERDYSLDPVDAINQLSELRDQATSKWRSMTPEERAPYSSLDGFLRAVQPPRSPNPAPEASAAVSPTLEGQVASPQGAAER